MAAKWWFSNLIISSTFISWLSIVRKSFLFSSIYIFVYNWMDLWITIFMGYNPLLLLYILMLKLSWIWPVWASLGWPLYPFDISPSIFENFLIWGTIKGSRVIWFFSCPNPRGSHFSKVLWFLLLDNGWYLKTNIWALSLLAAIRVSLVPVLLNGQSWEVYVCKCTWICVWGCIHMHIHIYTLTYKHLHL